MSIIHYTKFIMLLMLYDNWFIVKFQRLDYDGYSCTYCIYFLLQWNVVTIEKNNNMIFHSLECNLSLSFLMYCNMHEISSIKMKTPFLLVVRGLSNENRKGVMWRLVGDWWQNGKIVLSLLSSSIILVSPIFTGGGGWNIG